MIPKYPDYHQINDLLNKTHVDGIPNWTTQEQMDAYKALQTLMFYWFRKEIQ